MRDEVERGSLFDTDKLHGLMEQGWNLHIECKGRGRDFGMTFEASAQKTPLADMTDEEKVACFYVQAHAVGNTLDELLDKLKSQLSRR